MSQVGAVAATPAGGGTRRWLWQGVAVAGLVVLLAVLRAMRPGIWLLNDKRNQYLPVLQDIGRRLRAGDFPVIDPELGTGGNYALDVQYGLYDPLHLAVGYGLSFVDDLHLAGWLMSVPFLALLAWGTTALLQRLEVPGLWSAVAGVGAGTSGYLLFHLATFWWPGVVGTAFLPWFWWAWLGEPRLRRLLLIAASSYLVVASGWPPAWLAYAMLSAGLLVEAMCRHGRPRWSTWSPFVARALAAGAGVAVGATNVVTLARASEWTVREQGIENTYYNTVNWADVFSFALPYLHGDLTSHGGAPTTETPFFFFGWFLLGLAWLTCWDRTVLRHPGVVTAAVATALALLGTQLPSDLGPIRVPSRQLAGLQLFGLVLLVLAWRASPARPTRARVAGALLTYAAMALVAWSRTPTEGEVVVGVVAGLVAVGGLVALWSRFGATAAAAWALVGTMVLTALALRLEYPDEEPRVMPQVTDLTVRADEQPAFAFFTHRASRASWLEEGIGIGFSALSEENRYAPGYSSVSQRYYDQRFRIITPSGKTAREAVNALHARESRTGLRWSELLGLRTVLVHRSRVGLFERLADEEWAPVARSEHFVKYTRTAPPPDDQPAVGRVTATLGDVGVEAVSVGDDRQVYDVDAPGGGTVVMRDVYWPGYVATLDGERLPVAPFQRMLVSVTLPPGSTGELVVRYRPQSPKTVAATVGGGGLLLVGSLALHLFVVRRNDPARDGSARRRGRVRRARQE